jgi:hypothetical protein
MGLLKHSGRIQKFQFRRGRILIPADHLLALILQRHRQGQLRTDAVAVRPDVPDDAKRPVFAQRFQDPVNDFGVTFHTGVGLSP